MTWHSYLFETQWDNTYWAWVEYFFLLSGDFTMSHFMRRPVPEESGRAAVAYTLRKFFAYAPYLIQILPLLADGHIGRAWRTIGDLPYELLLLSSSGPITANWLPYGISRPCSSCCRSFVGC